MACRAQRSRLLPVDSGHGFSRRLFAHGSGVCARSSCLLEGSFSGVAGTAPPHPDFAWRNGSLSRSRATRHSRWGHSGSANSEGFAMFGGITARGYGSRRVRRLQHRQVATAGWRAPPGSERIAAETEPDLRSEQGVLVRLLSWLARWTPGRHRHPRGASSTSVGGLRQAHCARLFAMTCRRSTLPSRMGLRHRCPRSCATSSSVIWIVESAVHSSIAPTPW